MHSFANVSRKRSLLSASLTLVKTAALVSVLTFAMPANSSRAQSQPGFYKSMAVQSLKPVIVAAAATDSPETDLEKTRQRWMLLSLIVVLIGIAPIYLRLRKRPRTSRK